MSTNDPKLSPAYGTDTNGVNNLVPSFKLAKRSVQRDINHLSAPHEGNPGYQIASTPTTTELHNKNLQRDLILSQSNRNLFI